MVLLSFSDSKHVPMILDGRKAQTTRKPRKNPVKVGDILQVYFRSRMRKSCTNCLKYSDITGNVCPIIISDSHYCPKHSNYFGTAKVINVYEIRGNVYPIECRNLFSSFSPEQLEIWAKADGFENFKEADEWFARVNGPNWMEQEWDIIYFEGDWLKGANNS